MRAALLVLAVAALAGGCGGGSREEARDAVNDLYAAFRERDTETLCRKQFPSSLLPKAMGDQFGITRYDTGGSPREWADSERECRSAFGDEEFDAAGRVPDDDVSTDDVRLLEDFRGAEGITAAAEVRVEGMTPGHVVEYDGDWKVVALIR